jgi:hypothetical protein
MPLGVVSFIFFLYIFINLFKTSYIGDVPVGERATPTDVVVFFYKITENKKKLKTPMARLQSATDSGALPFVFLKF